GCCAISAWAAFPSLGRAAAPSRPGEPSPRLAGLLRHLGLGSLPLAWQGCCAISAWAALFASLSQEVAARHLKESGDFLRLGWNRSSVPLRTCTTCPTPTCLWPTCGG
ncbi:hypothetical protein CYMTET_33532, partial [Cymbomonas tetramitiformis]